MGRSSSRSPDALADLSMVPWTSGRLPTAFLGHSWADYMGGLAGGFDQPFCPGDFIPLDGFRVGCKSAHSNHPVG